MSSKLDYLQKYLDPAPEKKRRKKPGVSKPATFKVVDNDEQSTVKAKGRFSEVRLGQIADEAPVVVATYEEFQPKQALPSGMWEEKNKPSDLPPKRVRYSSPSPPRRPAGNNFDRDLSPPRRRPDLSPPRRRHDSPDLSPPRRRHDSPDLSPPRRTLRKSPDLSPPRRTLRKSPDLSPPRRGRHDSPDHRQVDGPTKQLSRDASPPRRPPADKAGPDRQRMGDGMRSGLQSAQQLKAEIEAKKKRESDRFKAATVTDLGKDAATVYRDRHGKKLDGLTELMRSQKGQELASDDAGMEWGKGLVQQQAQQNRVDDEAYEAAKPLARYADDADLEAMQKAAPRWGDPMAHLVASQTKKRKLSKAEKKAQKKALKKAAKKGKKLESRPVYKGAYAANRYGIPPGYRWDGVDRSNGFEKKYFQKLNERKHRQATEYMSNVADW